MQHPQSRVHNDWFTLLSSARAPEGPHGEGMMMEGRFCITISKRVSKKAVVRNRLSRQIKSFIRTEGFAQKAVDAVLICKPFLQGPKGPLPTYVELRGKLTPIFRKTLAHLGTPQEPTHAH